MKGLIGQKLKVLAISIAVLFTVNSIFAQEEEPVTWKGYWDNGFQLKSSDKNFVLKFGGRIQGDISYYFAQDAFEDVFGVLDNGFEFRRVRFYHEGLVYKIMKYKLQLDFAKGNITFKDVYIGFQGIKGLGTIKIGHFKEPIRLEALTSSKYITFMERAPTVAFIPERNIGLMFNNNHIDGQLTWAIGIFRRGDGTANQIVAGDEINLTTRLTGLPYYDKENKRLVHLGGAFSFRNPSLKLYSIITRPESHLGPKIINTGAIGDVDHYFVGQGEVAVVTGPFSMQGEVITSTVSSSPYDSLAMVTLDKTNTFFAYYAYASYFFTKESRPFKTSSASFSRVKPKKNVGQGGCGAWELGVRYSAVDLDNGDITGGKLKSVTLGLNWYLNPVSRIMLNYVYTKRVDIGNIHVIQSRFQIDF